jgi:hypothetical protein
MSITLLHQYFGWLRGYDETATGAMGSVLAEHSQLMNGDTMRLHLLREVAAEQQLRWSWLMLAAQIGAVMAFVERADG